MEWVGKKIVRYGEREFIGDEYSIPISYELWREIILIATMEELNEIMQTQLRFENFEAAVEIKQLIEQHLQRS